MTKIVPTLDMAQARLLTDEVRADATAMWEKLRTLYEGRAHIALGYSSWADYCAAEFDMRKSQAYRLLDAGRVRHLLGAPIPQLGNESKDAQKTEHWNGELPAPTRESVARGLAAMAKDDPEGAVRAWEKAYETYGQDATAEQVGAIVMASVTGSDAPPVPPQENWKEGTEVRAFLRDVRDAVKTKDPRTARRALAKWRSSVWTQLDQIAKSDG
jgi:hypothetical protein